MGYLGIYFDKGYEKADGCNIELNVCNLYGIYMGFIKTVMTTLPARHQKKHRCKEETFGLCGRRRGWDNLRE